MPALDNPRHERFAQVLFAGLYEQDNKYSSNGRAYVAAGYHAKDAGKDGGSAEAAASRLLKKVKVFDRVRELQREAAMHAKESLEKLVAELNQDRLDAKQDRAHGAAITAVMGKAKLLGLVTEKREDVTKRTLNDAKSINDVAIALLNGVGHEAPSDADVALAVQAHDTLMAELERIRDRAQGLLSQ